MRAEGQVVSITQLCRWFGVPRSTFYYRPALGTARPPVIDEAVAKQMRAIIDAEPVAGLRMIVPRVRRTAAQPVNRKKIHRIVKLNGWQVRGNRWGIGAASEDGYRAPSGPTRAGRSIRRIFSRSRTACAT